MVAVAEAVIEVAPREVSMAVGTAQPFTATLTEAPGTTHALVWDVWPPGCGSLVVEAGGLSAVYTAPTEVPEGGRCWLGAQTESGMVTDSVSITVVSGR